MLANRPLALALVIFGTPVSLHAQDCQQADVQEVSVEVNSAAIVRKNAPKELFGFNLPWREFQMGYFRNGKVRDELIELLAPFKGASYRYPGGSPGNWFEWRKAVGPAEQREALHGDFERYAVAQFGLPEFADFVSRVDGRALLTLNLVGPYKKAPLSPSELATDTLELLSHLRDKTAFSCAGGDHCRLMAVELGNELDWTPYSWPAQTYITRADAVVTAVSAAIPEVRWIANGRTAPWGAKAPDYKTFNADLAAGLARKVEAIAIHPYYDGISVPAAAQYVDDFGSAWANARSKSSVFVTEHARWPAQPATGEWKINWYQGTGLGGAISSADFLLAIAGKPQVAAANWHALGVAGPWQLVRWDKAKDQLYPSPVYWGLRTLREGYLDHLVQTRYRQPQGSTYQGGYGVRLVGMAAADGSSASLLGVNRNARAYKLRITWAGTPRKSGSGTLRSVSGASEALDNTDQEPQKLVMASSSQSVSAGRATSVWCVPAHAVFSIVEP
jgi:alpha-L-arabinofuranosidase